MLFSRSISRNCGLRYPEVQTERETEREMDGEVNSRWMDKRMDGSINIIMAASIKRENVSFHSRFLDYSPHVATVISTYLRQDSDLFQEQVSARPKSHHYYALNEEKSGLV